MPSPAENGVFGSQKFLGVQAPFFKKGPGGARGRAPVPPSFGAEPRFSRPGLSFGKKEEFFDF